MKELYIRAYDLTTTSEVIITVVTGALKNDYIGYYIEDKSEPFELNKENLIPYKDGFIYKNIDTREVKFNTKAMKIAMDKNYNHIYVVDKDEEMLLNTVSVDSVNTSVTDYIEYVDAMPSTSRYNDFNDRKLVTFYDKETSKYVQKPLSALYLDNYVLKEPVSKSKLCLEYMEENKLDIQTDTSKLTTLYKLYNNQASPDFVELLRNATNRRISKAVAESLIAGLRDDGGFVKAVKKLLKTNPPKNKEALPTEPVATVETAVPVETAEPVETAVPVETAEPVETAATETAETTEPEATKQ